MNLQNGYPLESTAQGSKGNDGEGMARNTEETGCSKLFEAFLGEPYSIL